MQVYCTAANVNYADLDIKTRDFRFLGAKNWSILLSKSYLEFRMMFLQAN